MNKKALNKLLKTPRSTTMTTKLEREYVGFYDQDSRDKDDGEGNRAIGFDDVMGARLYTGGSKVMGLQVFLRPQ